MRFAATIAMLAVFADRTHAQKERKLDERINANAQQVDKLLKQNNG